MRSVALPGALTLLACASPNPWAATPSPAADLPAAFVFDSSRPTPAAGGAACLTPLVDPGGGTKLSLVRSASPSNRSGYGPAEAVVGDYAVTPEGRYGVGPRQLLRLDCGTGKPLGIVPR